MESKRWSMEEKEKLFSRIFSGRTDVYGTYDPKSGRGRQVKSLVTSEVIRAHIQGNTPFGVYLLVSKYIRSLAIDIDEDDPQLAQQLISIARQCGIIAYIERSKSKGYHIWIFFENAQTSALKARAVAHHFLRKAGIPNTEVFPKQDALDSNMSYGNFINAPLFGACVSQGRTVFLDPNASMKPYSDQWEFLNNINTVSEKCLDGIIRRYNLLAKDTNPRPLISRQAPSFTSRLFMLPICAQRMLYEGVRSHQRSSCFRLAVQLRKTGLPLDIAIAALKAWARKNKPQVGKRIITEREIVSQTECAFARQYRSCGCEDAIVSQYCDPSCGLFAFKNRTSS